MERIIQTSSKPNDIVLDPFCGCGTALVASQKLGRQWIGIDISPTACRVMAKRLRDVCGVPEDERLWKIGRGLVVRDLPWTEEKLRAIPPFEFENWAVIALGGIPNKTQCVSGQSKPASDGHLKTSHLDGVVHRVGYPSKGGRVYHGEPDQDGSKRLDYRALRTRLVPTADCA